MCDGRGTRGGGGGGRGRGWGGERDDVVVGATVVVPVLGCVGGAKAQRYLGRAGQVDDASKRVSARVRKAGLVVKGQVRV